MSKCVEGILKPCPFCGGEAKRIDIDATHSSTQDAGGSYIACVKCYACSPIMFGEKIGLEESWNTRTDSAHGSEEWIEEAVYLLQVAPSLFNKDKGLTQDEGMYKSKELMWCEARDRVVQAMASVDRKPNDYLHCNEACEGMSLALDIRNELTLNESIMAIIADREALRQECAKKARDAILDFGRVDTVSYNPSMMIRKEMAAQLAERAILHEGV